METQPNYILRFIETQRRRVGDATVVNGRTIDRSKTGDNDTPDRPAAPSYGEQNNSGGRSS